jgi:acyl carrier protein
METIVNQLAELLAENYALPVKQLKPDTRFEELDLDSLVLIELTVILQTRWGVALADGELRPEQTIAELAALLNAKGVQARSGR